MFTNKTVTELLDAFASPEPTPGGGSAAALAGATGAALLAMVAGLPKTKNNTPEERVALDKAHTELVELQRSLTRLIDRDAEAYDLVVAAFRKPKGTDEEKAARSKAIQQAMQVATDVPMETVRACAGTLAAGRAVADCGNPSAKSDLAVGIQLLTTGALGAALNVEVNIGSVKDQAYIEGVGKDLRSLREGMGASVRHINAAAGILDLQIASARRSGPILPAH